MGVLQFSTVANELPLTAMKAATVAMTAKTERADAIRWIQAQMADYGLWKT